MVDYGSGVLGPLGTRTVSGDWDQAGVWAFGDSILRADYPDLVARVPVALAVDAQSSRPTPGCVDALEERLTACASPAVVVMACGTNDIFDPPAMAAQTERVHALLPGTSVVWVDTWVRRWKRTDSTEQRLFDQQNSGWVNAYIHEAAGRFGWRVARWSGYLSSPNSSGALNRPTQCLVDGVHTSEVGRAVRNTLIAQALA